MLGEKVLRIENIVVGLCKSKKSWQYKTFTCDGNLLGFANKDDKICFVLLSQTSTLFEGEIIKESNVFWVDSAEVSKKDFYGQIKKYIKKPHPYKNQ